MDACAQYNDPAIAKFLEGPSEERIAFLAADWKFDLPASRLLETKLLRLIDYPDRDRPRCMLVLGYSGMGKTHVARQVRNFHPSNQNDPKGIVERPVLYFQVEPKPTVYGILCAAAEAADIPVRNVEQRNLHSHIKHQLEALELRMVIVDEVQTLLNVKPHVAQPCCDLLKWFGNITRRPVVALGTPDAVSLFNRDPQLKSRFRRFELPRWELSTELQQFVKAILMRLPLKLPWDPKLLEEEGLRQILKYSDRTTGGILDCLKEAAIDAIFDGRESITVKDLQSMG